MFGGARYDHAAGRSDGFLQRWRHLGADVDEGAAAAVDVDAGWSGRDPFAGGLAAAAVDLVEDLRIDFALRRRARLLFGSQRRLLVRRRGRDDNAGREDGREDER